MRYTEYHAGVPVIKKQYYTEAAAKLAHFEDAEELEDLEPLLKELHKLTDKFQHTDPEAVYPITLAAVNLTQLDTFMNSAMAKMILKNQDIKVRLEEVVKDL